MEVDPAGRPLGRGTVREQIAREVKARLEIASAGEDEEEGGRPTRATAKPAKATGDAKAETADARSRRPEGRDAKAEASAGAPRPPGRRSPHDRERDGRGQRHDKAESVGGDVMRTLLLAVALAAVAAAPARRRSPPRSASRCPRRTSRPAPSACASIAGSPSSPVEGTDVTLLVNGTPRVARTDSAGRAIFKDLPAGATVQAKVVDDDKKETHVGERSRCRATAACA